MIFKQFLKINLSNYNYKTPEHIFVKKLPQMVDVMLFSGTQIYLTSGPK